VSFLTSPAFGSFSRGLPRPRDLPVAYALFVRLSAFFFWRIHFFNFRSCRAIRTVLIRSSNQSLFWQLRFIQTRNLPELLDSTRNGFSSFLTADSSFAFGARERTRGIGEFCLRRPPFGWFKRSRANQPNPTFPRLPGIILETFNLNFSTVTVRFVHSLNCEHHISFLISYNELI
jgi:hypothetical protein